MQKDNGLEADTFVFLGTVRTSRSDELLDDLAAEGIAAYAVSGEPAERLYVDRHSLGYAKALVRRSGAAVDDEPTGDDAAGETEADDPAAEDAEDTTEDTEADDDDAFEQLVADFDRTDDDERPWPDAEDLADSDSDDDADEGDGKGEDDDEPEVKTVGKNKAKVSVIKLDTTPAKTADDEEEHYVKPAPPSLPKGDLWTKVAWLVMLAALAYPIAGLILHWHMPGWAIALAVVAFIAGIVTHVVRLRDTSGHDDPDDGAVV